jgi:hypothetical protein
MINRTIENKPESQISITAPSDNMLLCTWSWYFAKGTNESEVKFKTQIVSRNSVIIDTGHYSKYRPFLDGSQAVTLMR